MEIKKISIFLMTLVLVFAFVACGDDDETDPITSSSAAVSSVTSTSSTGSSNSSTSTSSSVGTSSSTAGTSSSAAVTPGSDLFISEYFEGTAQNKFIEIYNGTGAAVALADYTLASYYNGTTPPATPVQLSLAGASLANGAVLVVANDAATIYTTGDIKVAYYSGSPAHFGGNDPVGLFKSGTLIDIIGTIGDSADFGKDKKFVRKPGKGPAATWDIADWIEGTALDTDVGTIGSHTF